jgi:hypothetical protein
MTASSTPRALDLRQQQEQEQEQEQKQAVTSYGPPTPAVVSDAPLLLSHEPSWLELALDEYKAGRLVPVEVELGPMPPRAGGAMIAVAEHMRLLMGLRLALGDTRPLPYATSMPAQAGIPIDQGAASRVIRRLVEFGVIEYCGKLLPLRPGRDGTKMYGPPGGEA